MSASVSARRWQCASCLCVAAFVRGIYLTAHRWSVSVSSGCGDRAALWHGHGEFGAHVTAMRWARAIAGMCGSTLGGASPRPWPQRRCGGREQNSTAWPSSGDSESAQLDQRGEERARATRRGHRARAAARTGKARNGTGGHDGGANTTRSTLRKEGAATEPQLSQ